MQRSLMQDLIAWKNSHNRKPLILRGARQVGKTWILKEFGKQEFPDLAYVRLEDNEAMRILFEGSLDPQRIIDGLSLYSSKPINSDTLVVLDEVQAIPRALTALKYFYEEMPEQPIAVVGSLLGVLLSSKTSFPVGKVSFLDLFPMTFEEFLLAHNEKRFVELIQSKDYGMLKVFSEQLIDYLKRYYFVGGMPEAVLEHSVNRNMQYVRTIQKAILGAYAADFSKYTSKDVAERCRQVWRSIPAQLGRENKKFMYGAVQKGSRGRDYQLALQFLSDSGLIHQVSRVSKPGLPLKAYEDSSAFKIFFTDVGLLGAMSDLDESTLLENSNLFVEFKGALTEQYVLQELKAACGYNPFYWSAEKSTGEIDFLIQGENTIFPIEVKAAENLKSKSLRVFSEKYSVGKAIRLSMSDYRDQNWMMNIPLYAVSSLKGM